MRKAVLAVVVAGIAAVSAVSLRLERGRAAASAAAPVAERPAAAAKPTELSPADVPSFEARTPAAEPAASIAPEAEPMLAGSSDEPGRAQGEPTRLRGTIAVVDEQGVEHPAEDGDFTFWLWSGNSGSGHEVEVAGGRWSTVLPADEEVESLGVGRVRLRGRAATHENGDDPARLPVPPDGWLELRVRWPRGSILSVRDRQSGLELDSVWMSEVDGWPENEYGHPGTAAQAARDLGPSPIVIPPAEWGDVGMRVLFVRSPEYAWGRIQIDEKLGGERVLLLDPAGELEVALVGPLTDPGTELRIFGTGFQPVFAARIVDPSVLVDALAPGTYRVKAEIGNFWDDPLVLGETTAEVVPGGRSSVTITLEGVAAREEVGLAGTLVLPDEWGLDDFDLAFELLETPLGGWDGHFSIDRSEMESEGLPRGHYRWTSSSVQPGRYQIALRELGFLDLLEVPPTGLENAHIEIQPPCDVAVRCIDDETGSDVTVDRVVWNVKVPKGVKGWSTEQARWNERSGCWEFRAPRGELTISTWAMHLEHSSTTIVAGGGRNEAELRVKPATGLRLVLQDGETQLPWQDEWTAKIHPLEGQDEGQGWCWGGNVRHREPGRYMLELGEISGYEPIPATDVRLEKGVVKEHVIELRRRP